ncbi:response regulator transcription factor [Halocella sp. SP3-1]|uniref:response regulator transcription factor n=1 Tax=Halocella sp. SP3-1 TaxID=2382161 RepID=UPI000F7619EA|nr:response regulator transcription factor [Halocella sp. SP3-1]AZO93759.1 DNA-binding response regulator [Halocella sp. SP3-1]
MDLHGKNILVIEDDQHIFSLIKMMLKPYNVNLVFKADGESGLKEALSQDYDLILLDIMLPRKDGWEICREIKNSGKETAIIMLTAKAEETDKVLGLEIGADDYVTKPFSPRLLIARIKAVLRRFENTRNNSNEKLDYSEIALKINPSNYSVEVQGEIVNLTPKEFELLSFLAQNEEQVFKREQLLDYIWGFENYSETRTIDEHVKRIRQKLAGAGLETIPLQTVWGVGYKFSTREQKKDD